MAPANVAFEQGWQQHPEQREPLLATDGGHLNQIFHQD